jgi:hypothetical protein
MSTVLVEAMEVIMQAYKSLFVMVSVVAVLLTLGGQPTVAVAAGRPSAASEAELQMRLMLLQQSMGFGGIFGPMLNGLRSGGGSSGNGCGSYTDYAACQAYKAGDGWAADRLQRKQSNGVERSWYNR